MEETIYYETNEFQTKLTPHLEEKVGKKIWGQLMEYIETVQFIKWLISPASVRGYAKDRPRDENGKIIVDITKPHILEDMDFFRERALFFKKHGVYTHIPKNSNPKSEYANFWKEELRRWKYGLTRPSDGEWIPGGLYYYWNYSQIWMVEKELDENGNEVEKKGKRVHDFPRPYLGDYLFYHYLEQATQLGKHGKMLKARGIGAAGPNSEPILTPEGFKTYGDIKVGDLLIDRKGNPTKVLEVFPQGKMDIYEVELNDGRSTRCTLNHNWSVYSKKAVNKKELKVITLEKMLKKGYYWKLKDGNKSYNYHLPEIEPVIFNNNDNLEIGPYALGALLGDGSMSTPDIRIAVQDRDKEETLNNILTSLGEGYRITYRDGINYSIIDDIREEAVMYHGGINPIGRNRLKASIERLGLNVDTNNKFIPEAYKKSSVEERIELIKGLMDTDGSISTDGNLEFSNSNERLIKDVAEVLRSLGIRCTLGKGRPARKKYFGEKECNIKQEWRLYISTNLNLFKLERKKKRCKVKNTFKNVAIVNIKKLDYQEDSTCFIVDNEEHIYLAKDFIPTHNSFKFASMSPRNMYVLPGSGNPNFHLASDKSFLLGDKGIWGKVIDNLDWIANNTPLPKMRLIDGKKAMEVQLGVEDEYGARAGLLSSVFGISLKDNPDKARGVRGPLIHYEEDGLFPNLETAWNINREATEEDGIAYGLMFAAGTGGTEGASFEGSEKLFYKCDAYNIYGIPNVFDKNTDGKSTCGFFWGAYLNKGKGTTHPNGEVDVIKRLIMVLQERQKIADASNDPKALTQKKAETPITPQEAVMRTEGTIFPVSDLKDYLGQIAPMQSSFLASHYIGNLNINGDGEIVFSPNADVHIIREYPLQDNLRKEGGIEIFELPQKGVNGLIPKYRYIAGIDPYDDDHSTTTSLGSMFVFDLFTDRVVAEYTGRPLLANTFYENCYRLLKFYNAVGLYENDKKGLFTYFSNKNILHYLADAPQILKDMDIVKATNLFGNKAKGFNSGKIVNAWGRRLQADWMLSPAYGKEDKGILNLHTIRSLGYLREAIAWNADGNFDRVSAMTPVMILREEYHKHIMVAKENNQHKPKTLSSDPFFEVNYNRNNPQEYNKQLKEFINSEKSYNNLTLLN